MEIIGLIVLVCITGLLGAYTMSFQETTLSVGKKLAQDNARTGVQDAITPSGQTIRNIALWLMILVVFVYSLISFRWYLAFIFTILTYFVVIRIFKALMPKAESNFYLKKIRRNLERKQETYRSHNDGLREAVITALLTRFDSLFKEPKAGEPA